MGSGGRYVLVLVDLLVVDDGVGSGLVVVLVVVHNVVLDVHDVVLDVYDVVLDVVV